jgi:hypothetical protein
MIPDWIFQLLALGGTLATAYAAIKSDLVYARLTAEQAAKDAQSCHARLNEHIGVKH